MSRGSLVRLTLPALCALLSLVIIPGAAAAQRSAAPRHPVHRPPAVAVRGHVFIGGYFYDPFFGPYPWWPRAAYPYWYFPTYNTRAEVHLRVEPEEAEDAAVYVDGFYAGVVDDFNSVFQALPLTPGGHNIVLYLEGYRTTRRNVYLGPGSTFDLREAMERLPAGETSERPDVVPSVPTPPAGTYQTPVTPPRLKGPAPAAPAISAATGVGTLDLHVQPPLVQVKIDGQPWVSAEAGHFVVELAAGKHHLELSKAGAFRLATDIEIREGDTTELNLKLTAGT